MSNPKRLRKHQDAEKSEGQNDLDDIFSGSEGEAADGEPAASASGESEADDDNDETDVKSPPKKKRSRFIADEASEEDDEGEEEAENGEKSSRKKKKKLADESEDEDGDDGSNDHYERDGFVVDEPEEDGGDDEGDGGEGSERRKKKKKKKKRHTGLDEDDLRLVQEATGVQFVDDAASKFKRLKQKREQEEVEKRRAAERALKESLFGTGADDEDDEMPTKTLSDEEREFASEEEDDLDDFIVDEGEDGTARPRKPKGRSSTPRASSATMQQAADIFGDASFFEQGLPGADEEEEGEAESADEAEPGRPRRRREKKSIYESYEPSLLAARYITERDEEIRKQDVPERMQLRFPTSRPLPDDDELREEAKWIFSNNFGMDGKTVDPEAMVNKIISVLSFLRKDLFEVPFIATYRKDHYQPLDTNDLWTIYDGDEKWDHLQRRRRQLLSLFDKANVPDSIRDQLAAASSEAEIHDLYMFFRTHYASEDTVLHGRYKPAVKRDMYGLCKRAGLGRLVQNFGLSASQFAENVQAGYLVHLVQDCEQEPGELALEYIGVEFSSVDTVLRAASFMYSSEIGNDPVLRRWMRSQYEDRATISTWPTAKGRKEASEASHPFRAVLRLHRKPIGEFFTDNFHTQIMEIIKAEQHGFLTWKIDTTIPEMELNNDLLNVLRSMNTSQSAVAWNDLRRGALQDALDKFLYPMLEKHLKAKLIEAARLRVMYDITMRLLPKVGAGPFMPPRLSPDDPTPTEIKVMAACWGADKDTPTFCVMLDPDGEVVSHLKLNYVSRETREQEYERLRNFILHHEPHVVAVGAQLAARNLYEDFDKIRQELMADRRATPLHVTYVDMAVANIYATSERASGEFPEYPPALRKVISLGRLLLDPLTELASMCTESNDVLFLKLHPLQDQLEKESLLNIVERVFINFVNGVGVDINRAVNHKHAAAVLQFVSGLGPRKAQGLISAIYREGGKIASREQLEELLTPIVYVNCAGFIRIVDKHFRKNEDVDPLDNTRIHPEDYSLARKMAADALERDPTEDLIEELMERDDLAELLDQINLQAFADELARNGKPGKLTTLKDIKTELAEPFADHIRIDYKDPDPVELFTMLSGETEETLRPGSLVNARVTSVKERAVQCVLDSGLPAWIPISMISDAPIDDIRKDLDITPGQVLCAKIVRVHNPWVDACALCRRPIESDDLRRTQILPPQVCPQRHKFHQDCNRWGEAPALLKCNLCDRPPRLGVELSTRSADLQSSTVERDRMEALRLNDPSFVEDLEAETAAGERKKKQSIIKPRKIDHPYFKNFSSEEAEKYLADKAVGEMVIRPSSKPGFLVITWKMAENICTHIAIQEKDRTVNATVGKSLYIGDDRFDDLDEIIARYMEPMNANVQDLIGHAKFRNFSPQQVEELLRTEKARNPRGIPYFISFSPERLGTFRLSYLPNQTIKHERVLVTPDGFKFRSQAPFSSPDRLIAWFKANWSKVEAPKPKPVAPVVPREEPAPPYEQQNYGAPSMEYNNSQPNNNTQHNHAAAAPVDYSQMYDSYGQPLMSYGSQPQPQSAAMDAWSSWQQQPSVPTHPSAAESAASDYSSMQAQQAGFMNGWSQSETPAPAVPGWQQAASSSAMAPSGAAGADRGQNHRWQPQSQLRDDRSSASRGGPSNDTRGRDQRPPARTDYGRGGPGDRGPASARDYRGSDTTRRDSGRPDAGRDSRDSGRDYRNPRGDYPRDAGRGGGANSYGSSYVPRDSRDNNRDRDYRDRDRDRDRGSGGGSSSGSSSGRGYDSRDRDRDRERDRERDRDRDRREGRESSRSGGSSGSVDEFGRDRRPPTGWSSGPPAVPTTPGIPSTPGIPDTPAVPFTPGIPYTPGVPDTPMPPTTPGLPFTPGLPDTPMLPTTPFSQQPPVVEAWGEPAY